MKKLHIGYGMNAAYDFKNYDANPAYCLGLVFFLITCEWRVLYFEIIPPFKDLVL
jgi:hypothetical protein